MFHTLLLLNRKSIYNFRTLQRPIGGRPITFFTSSNHVESLRVLRNIANSAHCQLWTKRITDTLTLQDLPGAIRVKPLAHKSLSYFAVATLCCGSATGFEDEEDVSLLILSPCSGSCDMLARTISATSICCLTADSSFNFRCFRPLSLSFLLSAR